MPLPDPGDPGRLPEEHWERLAFMAAEEFADVLAASSQWSTWPDDELEDFLTLTMDEGYRHLDQAERAAARGEATDAARAMLARARTAEASAYPVLDALYRSRGWPWGVTNVKALRNVSDDEARDILRLTHPETLRRNVEAEFTEPPDATGS